jgi:hypothetical protein
MRAEEGDETVGEMADEAAKTKKELRESTETGEKVQKQEKDAEN